MAMFIVAARLAAAQERGQYPAGFRGLNAAEQPAPGFTYANFIYWYPSDTFKDKDGRTTALNFDLDLVADFNLLAYTPKKKFLGATFSSLVIVPITNVAITLPRLDAGVSGTGIGDIYAEPVSLQWAFKKGKVRTAYGFFSPTGQNGTTSDFFGHNFTLGGTYNPGKTGLWQINASSTWEAHHKKRNSDIKVGNNVTFEYGVGKTFVKNKGTVLLQLGVVGYSEFQLTNDTGAGVVPPNLGNKDRVHALGGEFGVIMPAKKFNVFVRILPEYAARSHTQGLTFLAGLGKTF